MHDTRWKQLFVTGGRQEQVVSVSQAIDHGIPRSTFVQAAHRLGMTNLGGGAWAQCGAPNTYRRKLWVAKLTLGNDVVFTGRTALWLRRIVATTPVEIDIFCGERALRNLKGRRCVRGQWGDEDTTINIEGFQTACVYRALRDAAAVVPVETLLRWLPAMDRLRLGSIEELAAYLEGCGRFPGVVNLRAAVATLRLELPHSGAERFARRLLRAADIAPHPRPYAVRTWWGDDCRNRPRIPKVPVRRRGGWSASSAH